MIAFDAHPDCDLCALHETCQSVGIPTRPLIPGPPQHTTAVFIIGKAPGWKEDDQNLGWVGPTADLVAYLVEAAGYSDRADVYLSNTCRCRPLRDSSLNRGQIKRCRPYLLEDITLLRSHYQRVILLSLGGEASIGIGEGSIHSLLSRQGHPFLGHLLPEPIEAFFTYHPAQLLPGRDPSLIDTIGTHFEMVNDALTGTYTPPAVIDSPDRCPLPPPLSSFPHLLSIDIETYGILKGRDQSVFHPVKSEVIDKIPAAELIVTVAIAYEDGEGRERTGLFLFQSRRERRVLYRWMFRLSQVGGTLLGKNTTFDILYLRHCDAVFRHLIAPHKRIKLDDVAIWNHLDYELRGEKGLKPLSRLFNLSNYDDIGVDAGQEGGKVRSPLSPKLWLYNATDAITNLRLRNLLINNISDNYGPDSPKLGSLCSELRSQILYCILGMAEAGIKMDRPALSAARDSLKVETDDLVASAKTEFDRIIGGKGSQADTRIIVEEALWAGGLVSDRRVQVTDKKRDISVNRDNINLAISALPPGDITLPPLLALRDYKDKHKLLTGYLNPLLDKPRKGLVGNIAYPSWYPVPSSFSELTDETGGTIQGRFAAKSPPTQTFPPSIQDTITSRFKGGLVLAGDMSQIELRGGAILSNDPIMMGEYRDGIDRHTATAHVIFPAVPLDDPEWATKWRSAGKVLNFLVLYRGGAGAFQDVANREAEIILPIATCVSALAAFDERYHFFRSWQDSLIETAISQGYIELPTGWSRTFLGGREAVERSYVNEICNMPIQLFAAQLCQSAQFHIHAEICRRGLRSRIVNQRHDDIEIDTHPSEEPLIRHLLTHYLINPPLYKTYCDLLDRSIPLDCEIKEIGKETPK